MFLYRFEIDGFYKIPIMATSQEEDVMVNGYWSVLCFEKFKTPWYRQCRPFFCHDCLSSYIKSKCTSIELQLRFHRLQGCLYIPSNGVPGKPEKWLVHFPITDFLQQNDWSSRRQTLLTRMTKKRLLIFVYCVRNIYVQHVQSATREEYYPDITPLSQLVN